MCPTTDLSGPRQEDKDSPVWFLVCEQRLPSPPGEEWEAKNHFRKKANKVVKQKGGANTTTATSKLSSFLVPPPTFLLSSLLPLSRTKRAMYTWPYVLLLLLYVSPEVPALPIMPFLFFLFPFLLQPSVWIRVGRRTGLSASSSSSFYLVHGFVAGSLDADVDHGVC